MRIPNQLFDPTELTNAVLGFFQSGDWNQGISAARIAPYIAEAELAHLKPVLGKQLYLDMISNRIAGDYLPETNNPNFPKVDMFPVGMVWYNRLFNEHIWRLFGKALSWTVMPYLSVQLDDEGVNASQQAAPTNVSGQVGKVMRAGIDTFKNEMVEFLCENKAEFPLWSGKYFDNCCSCTNPEKDPPQQGKKIKFWWS